MNMKTNTKRRFVIVILLILLVVLAFILFSVYRGFRYGAVHACVSSIKGNAAIALEKDEIKRVISPTREWRVLSKEERNLILNSFGDPYHFDCGGVPFFRNNDIRQGGDFQMSIRQIEGRIEVMVDGIE
jgi:hypothetical protein